MLRCFNISSQELLKIAYVLIYNLQRLYFIHELFLIILLHQFFKFEIISLIHSFYNICCIFTLFLHFLIIWFSHMAFYLPFCQMHLIK